MRLVLAAVLFALAVPPALGALEVSVDPPRIPGVSLGDARVWNAYVTVTVLQDGRPAAGASVELRGPAGTVARGDADAAGTVLIPVLSREPGALEVFVNGAPTGRRVELVEGPVVSEPREAPEVPPGTPSPLRLPLLPALAVVAGVVLAGLLVLRSRKRRRNPGP